MAASAPTAVSRAVVVASRRQALGLARYRRCYSSSSPVISSINAVAAAIVLPAASAGESSTSPCPRLSTLHLPQPPSPPPPSNARPHTSPRSSSSARIRPPRARAFHSYDHPSPTRDGNPFSGAAERAILAAALRRVPDYGFSADALALGARDAGLLDVSASLLPDGPFSLVRWHLVEQREALAARAHDLFSSQAGADGGTNTTPSPSPSPPPRLPLPLFVADKVEVLTWERLRANAPLIHRWQEALAIMAQPSYVPTSLRELAMLADEIWFLAGDVAVDPTWYAKRASLSAMYASAELFMTNDRSPGFADTRDFLRRRLDEARLVGDGAGAVVQWVGFTAGAAVNVLRSKGVPI